MLKKIAGFLDRLLYRISEMSRLVGGIILGGMILFIVADVASRYILNQPFPFSLELVERLLSIVVFFGLILCTARKGHVVLGVLVDKVSLRIQLTINSIVYFLSTAMFAVITWRLFVHVIQTKEIGTVTSILRIPHYPFILLVALSSVLITLLLFSQFVHYIKEVVSE